MKGHYLLILVLGLACMTSPADSSSDASPASDKWDEIPSPELKTITHSTLDTLIKPRKSNYELALEAQGLVDIQSLNPNILVDLKYATADNFLNEPVYLEINACYLQADVAAMLDSAQQALEAEAPEMQLLVFDGVRPHTVQSRMWELVKGTEQEKYVASPFGGGSNHNYGAAVDLGLSHRDTGMVDMGTPFDYFGPLAQPRYEEEFLRTGELSPAQAANRRLLRRAMNKAGFVGILSEWWHFNAFSKEFVREKYTMIE